MRHTTAKRLLPQLLDSTLEPSLDAGVRAHAAHCGACASRLAEYELCDELVGHLPLSVVPRVVSPSGEQRLHRLARWTSPRPEPLGWFGIEGFAAAAAAAALAGIVALGGTTHWVPAPEPMPSSLTQVAYVMPTNGRY